MELQQKQQEEFRRRLLSGIETVLAYEDDVKKAMALSMIPLDDLEKEVKELMFEKEKNQTLAYKDALVVVALKWFKHKFFKWCDKPMCMLCHETGENISTLGMAPPNEEEKKHWASRVEVYICSSCNVQIRFPRYNDPLFLCQSTRIGRCGEFANCFTFLLRALSYEVRYIMDFTDHVWTEYWSENQNRWILCDSCEASHDEPRLYAEGWKKKLSYVLAFSIDGVADVSLRYQKLDEEAIERRKNVVYNCVFIPEVMKSLTTQLRQALSESRRETLEKRDANEQKELTMLDEIDVINKQKRLPGRSTGSLEWRKARGELGDELSKDVNVVDERERIKNEFFLRRNGVSLHEAAKRAGKKK